MASAATTARLALAAALAAPGRLIYPGPRENMTAPCAVLRPASPWLETISIGATPALIAHYELICMVQANDDTAALANLEQLIEDTLDALPPNISCGDWTQPGLMDIGPNQYLTAQLPIAQRI